MLSGANESILVKVLSKPMLNIRPDCRQASFEKPLVRYKVKQPREGRERAHRAQPFQDTHRHTSWLNGASFPWDSKALAEDTASSLSRRSQSGGLQVAAPSRVTQLRGVSALRRHGAGEAAQPAPPLQGEGERVRALPASNSAAVADQRRVRPPKEGLSSKFHCYQNQDFRRESSSI